MEAVRMDAISSAGLTRLADPALRVAVRRPEANRAYAVRGVRLATPERFMARRDRVRTQKEQDQQFEISRDGEAARAIQTRQAETVRQAAETFAENSGREYNNRKTPLSESMLRSTLDKIDNYVSAVFHHLEYTYHEDSGEYFVKIIDDKTDEVIREIPPEKLLNIYSSMMEIAGIFYDKKR